MWQHINHRSLDQLYKLSQVIYIILVTFCLVTLAIESSGLLADPKILITFQNVSGVDFTVQIIVNHSSTYFGRKNKLMSQVSMRGRIIRVRRSEKYFILFKNIISS